MFAFYSRRLPSSLLLIPRCSVIRRVTTLLCAVNAQDVDAFDVSRHDVLLQAVHTLQGAARKLSTLASAPGHGPGRDGASASASVAVAAAAAAVQAAGAGVAAGTAPAAALRKAESMYNQVPRSPTPLPPLSRREVLIHVCIGVCVYVCAGAGCGCGGHDEWCRRRLCRRGRRGRGRPAAGRARRVPAAAGGRGPGGGSARARRRRSTYMPQTPPRTPRIPSTFMRTKLLVPAC